ncbi:hypothetical protein [Halobaculum sp. MBLA0143]|uniref:hypothetical protein n=1 Tax=Halobaculum sp. MBLA0143 TaxID=3079933 RepID=UPI0035262423
MVKTSSLAALGLVVVGPATLYALAVLSSSVTAVSSAVSVAVVVASLYLMFGGSEETNEDGHAL